MSYNSDKLITQIINIIYNLYYDHPLYTKRKNRNYVVSSSQNVWFNIPFIIFVSNWIGSDNLYIFSRRAKLVFEFLYLSRRVRLIGPDPFFLTRVDLCGSVILDSTAILSITIFIECSNCLFHTKSIVVWLYITNQFIFVLINE
jgi:hypothetical protein